MANKLGVVGLGLWLLLLENVRVLIKIRFKAITKLLVVSGGKYVGAGFVGSSKGMSGLG